MSSFTRRSIALAVVVAFAAGACSADDTDGPTAATDDSSVTSTTVVEDGSLDVRELVAALASDDLAGRDNLTPGSTAAQELIATELAAFADPAFPGAEELEGYLQRYDLGTNVVGVIPGAELADEYVLIGAHYDHLGSDCATEPGDDICNGATDNATGVAAAMAVGRSLAADGPRRSVVLAFWDGEEDSFDGSLSYIADPVASLDDTIGYVNFDIQGANLLPSLAEHTIMVGAETGGPNLVEAAEKATEASTLDTSSFSLLFGQGRSDHAPFAEAGVPVVFFTDANTGCYHTVKDDIDAVDFDKLNQQIATAEALSRDLVATDTPPEFDADAPATTFQDAAELLRVVAGAEEDFDLLSEEEQATTEQFLVDLQEVVDAGEEAFDDDANSVLLGGAVDFVAAMAATPCDPDLGQ